MPKQQETGIRNVIKEWLQWHGWFTFYNLQSLGSLKGISDLTAIKDGRTLWLEIKKPGGRQSEHQKKFESAIKAHGGEYVLADSVEVVEKYLREGK